MIKSLIGMQCPRLSRARVRPGSAGLVASAIAHLICGAAICFAADDLDALRRNAVKDAVERVAPSVVRIETIGGLEQVEDVQFGAGPTTGLIVDPHGYIVSSAFNFINKPSSIIVRLPNGTRKPARLVATDRVRMIVLLKIDAGAPLPVCEIAPEAEMRVGQWTIALGRTFEGEQPNISLGILSAKDRVWGKALQTDASVSPNNYGGPLVDIRGRVMGVLVPLSPEAADEMAGYEWYDSGIGFAVPAQHIQRTLPRLKKGEDLLQGLVGVSMQSPNIYTSQPVIASCRANSPAAAAGLKPGDRILEVEGRKIARTVEFREEINRRYAGDKIELAVMRDNKLLTRELTLADKIPPYQAAFLGVLPMRGGGDAGVKVRWVYPGSPAASAGVSAGDVIVALDGKRTGTREQMIEAMIECRPDKTVDLEFSHNGKRESRKLTLGAFAMSLPPAELPPACEKGKPADAKGLEIGVVKPRILEFPNEFFAFVPENYDRNVPHGLVVWLHGKGGLDWDKTLAAWRQVCADYNFILAAPKSADGTNWSPRDADLVDRLIKRIEDKYKVDPFRVVVHGQESGGSLASFVAVRDPQTIRAMVLVDAPLVAVPRENDPQYRFAAYIATSGKSSRATEKALSLLREMNIPLSVKKLGDEPRYFNADELCELARWIDMLDSL
jgi:serine protease Do